LQYIEIDPEEHYQQWMAATNALLENVLPIPTFPPEVITYLYRHKGRACRLAQDYQSTLTLFKDALTLLPNYAMLYIGQGLVYRCMGRYEGALADFERAIALDGNNA
jgi:tetratricopeptide (TPR) repeat protein